MCKFPNEKRIFEMSLGLFDQWFHSLYKMSSQNFLTADEDVQWMKRTLYSSWTFPRSTSRGSHFSCWSLVQKAFFLTTKKAAKAKIAAPNAESYNYSGTFWSQRWFWWRECLNIVILRKEEWKCNMFHNKINNNLVVGKTAPKWLQLV